ncbi:MAG TPA: hypothetical protein VJH90_02540 [archaeon]|nr:hypothetical protein [archaeon]
MANEIHTNDEKIESNPPQARCPRVGGKYGRIIEHLASFDIEDPEEIYGASRDFYYFEDDEDAPTKTPYNAHYQFWIWFNETGKDLMEIDRKQVYTFDYQHDTVEVNNKEAKSALSVRERLLLYLRSNAPPSDTLIAPAALTQEGIAKGIGTRRSHVPRSVSPLIDGGYVEGKLLHIKGQHRRKKTYFLTARGEADADLVRRVLMLKSIEEDRNAVVKKASNKRIQEAQRYVEGLSMVADSLDPYDAERLGEATKIIREIAEGRISYYEHMAEAAEKKGNSAEQQKAQARIIQLRHLLETGN